MFMFIRFIPKANLSMIIRQMKFCFLLILSTIYREKFWAVKHLNNSLTRYIFHKMILLYSIVMNCHTFLGLKVAFFIAIYKDYSVKNDKRNIHRQFFYNRLRIIKRGNYYAVTFTVKYFLAIVPSASLTFTQISYSVLV